MLFFQKIDDDSEIVGNWTWTIPLVDSTNILCLCRSRTSTITSSNSVKRISKSSWTIYKFCCVCGVWSNAVCCYSDQSSVYTCAIWIRWVVIAVRCLILFSITWNADISYRFRIPYHTKLLNEFWYWKYASIAA